MGRALAIACVAIFGCRSEAPAPAPPALRRPPPPALSLQRGRLAEAPDVELLATARELLDGGGREKRCGPYPLYTDVADARLVAVCGRLASRLDDVYAARYGLEPRGEPASAIVLFAGAESYRAFARHSGVPLGYAGYALAARGLAVFYAGGRPLDDFATTLGHELTHLVNRRALGVNLPPWLAEGLADGVGDTATPQGFRPLETGIQAQFHGALASRLREARTSGRAGNLERLAGLKRGEFDRGDVAYDYEHSALFVRFLLAEPELAPGFRKFLDDFARGAIYDSAGLASVLGSSWADLDQRFSHWLREQIE